MSFTNFNKIDSNKSAKQSDPINISPSSTLRRRSASISSSSSGSGSSPEPPTPLSSLANPQRISIPSPSTSPILSYVLAQSPVKSAPGSSGTFPFKRKFGTVPVYEGSRSRLHCPGRIIYPCCLDEEPEPEVPVAAHARRASTAVAGRFLKNPSIPEPHHERGTNTLRRLSLSSFMKVSPPSLELFFAI